MTGSGPATRVPPPRTPPRPAPVRVDRRRTARARVAALLVLGVLMFVVVAMTRSWSDGSEHGPWRVVFTGFGTVRGEAKSLHLSPRPADSTEHTHAALVVSRRSYGDLSLTTSVTTERQLRTGSPNLWEVGWVLWHYQDPHRFYALALKPNGWELSKQDPEHPGGQRFLASGTNPAFPIGTTHVVGVTQVGNTIKVSADGLLLTAFSDDDKPYLSGANGFYTEDAEVRFRSIRAVEVTAP